MSERAIDTREIGEGIPGGYFQFLSLVARSSLPLPFAPELRLKEPFIAFFESVERCRPLLRRRGGNEKDIN